MVNIKNIAKHLKKNISNVPGWRTNRKIAVIESDDWGSIRMSSRSAYHKLLKDGIPVDESHYTKFDALESNQDLENLFAVLSRFKDKTDRSPVFTGVQIVANPNFDKIKESGFTQYFYEPFNETLNRYDSHDRVLGLYQQGIKNRLMVPVFHGREHLNVQRWMRALKSGNQSILNAFDHQVTGISKGINSIKLPDVQAAFDLDVKDDIVYMESVLKEGLELFELLFGYSSKYFVPTNGPFNNELEVVLKRYGIQYINTAKKQIEPLGDGQYKTNIRFLGQKNGLGQRYITRNCFFEPSSMEYGPNKDWVNDCLGDIEIAFRWNKPAVISSHRVNYIGFLDPKNRERGLGQLDLLLKKMLLRWPDIEFMTSVELGDLISASK
ncbi:hypothetical protein [Rhodonellum sp.]|uniref:hypothetical protein n=1 Tax=Rhodonellum sp. TaxID=2231180 RepID=UPI002715A23D|nr:hypothetical protein [Rhodonellum sp.]MDO9551553.1 hypothetical protein [Rhodonellum sp.]